MINILGESTLGEGILQSQPSAPSRGPEITAAEIQEGEALESGSTRAAGHSRPSQEMIYSAGERSGAPRGPTLSSFRRTHLLHLSTFID